MKRSNIKSGAVFTYWTVLERCARPPTLKNKRSYFLCRCACGTIRVVGGDSLLSGHSKSCGCRFRQPQGLATAKALYKRYKRSAVERKIKFKLSFWVFIHLTQECCFYCGAIPTDKHNINREGYYGSYFSNGLDRFDSNKGYTRNNVVACCKECNIMRMQLSGDSFISKCTEISTLHNIPMGGLN